MNLESRRDLSWPRSHCCLSCYPHGTRSFPLFARNPQNLNNRKIGIWVSLTPKMPGESYQGTARIAKLASIFRNPSGWDSLIWEQWSRYVESMTLDLTGQYRKSHRAWALTKLTCLLGVTGRYAVYSGKRSFFTPALWQPISLQVFKDLETTSPDHIWSLLGSTEYSSKRGKIIACTCKQAEYDIADYQSVEWKEQVIYEQDMEHSIQPMCGKEWTVICCLKLLLSYYAFQLQQSQSKKLLYLYRKQNNSSFRRTELLVHLFICRWHEASKTSQLAGAVFVSSLRPMSVLFRVERSARFLTIVFIRVRSAFSYFLSQVRVLGWYEERFLEREWSID